MSSVPHPEVIRRVTFAEFEVDLRTSELRRSGAKVKLQEQPFRILAFLLERPGEIVPRDELRQRLWPSEFVDFDHSLNAAIRKLREALDDSAGEPRFIETLARRGYRFIAPVTPVDARPQRRSWRWVAAAAVVVASLAGFAISRPVPARGERINAIAVLPFTADSGDAAGAADRTTEMVIDSLTTAVPNVRVMARASVFGFQGSKLDPWKIGYALHCDSVVLGHIRRDKDAYSIRVEMIRVRDGAELWGDRFEATRLSELPGRITGALAPRLHR